MPDIDVDQIGEALNNKMDRDLNNRSTNSGLRKLIENYNNGSDWYKVYAEIQEDGTTKLWCEQGGSSSSDGEVTFLKPFASTDISFTLTSKASSNPVNVNAGGTSIYELSTTKFKYSNGSPYKTGLWWEARGYISGTSNSNYTSINTGGSSGTSESEGTVSNEVLQRITALESEVANMLGRIDYSNEAQFVISSNGGSYTCLSDGYIKLQGAGSANTWTTEDTYDYLKYLAAVTVNNKNVLDVTVTYETGSNSNNTYVIYEALNEFISVSAGDIIHAVPVPSNSLYGGIYGYYSFSFFPQKSN